LALGRQGPGQPLLVVVLWSPGWRLGASFAAELAVRLAEQTSLQHLTDADEAKRTTIALWRVTTGYAIEAKQRENITISIEFVILNRVRALRLGLSEAGDVAGRKVAIE
jgi:sporulation-control protein spo0M